MNNCADWILFFFWDFLQRLQFPLPTRLKTTFLFINNFTLPPFTAASSSLYYKDHQAQPVSTYFLRARDDCSSTLLPTWYSVSWHYSFGLYGAEVLSSLLLSLQEMMISYAQLQFFLCSLSFQRPCVEPVRTLDSLLALWNVHTLSIFFRIIKNFFLPFAN